MKRDEILIIGLRCLMICIMISPAYIQAQAPQSFSYQAIIRNSAGEGLCMQDVSIRVSILQGSVSGAPVYVETHQTTTTYFGLVNLMVGSGTVVSGNFSSIQWGAATHFIKIEVNPDGIAYIDMGTHQLLSVPYALYAKDVSTVSPADLTHWNAAYGWGNHASAGYLTAEVDGSTTNEIQSLSIAGNQLSISSGNTVTLPGDNWGTQAVSTNATLTGNGTTGNALAIAQQGATNGQVLTWNGSAWLPGSTSATGWSLTGNSGTNPATNFLGTTDLKPLKFRVNNQPSGEINPISRNAFFGLQAGANTTGTNNTASGSYALYTNTTGNDNAAHGYLALYSNTTGQKNTAQGYSALYSNSTGNYNTALGATALEDNTTGNNNTASGYSALYSNTTGYKNTAHGSSALTSNTTGYNNIAVGMSALAYNTTGFLNTASGAYALYSNTTGYSNTAGGSNALFANTTGSNNTANGSYALSLNINGSGNSANGCNALFSNTTGSFNTANGINALYYNTTGNYNTSNGSDALYSNTNGYDNTANGVQALFSNTTGSSNTASGVSALYSNTTGSFNMAIGLSALYGNTTGNYNTAIGVFALNDLTTGNYNTAVGYNAGPGTETGIENTIAIGKNALVTASNQVRLGNDNITTFYCMGAYAGEVGTTNKDLFVDNTGKIGFITSSARFKEDITDMESVDWLYSLRPVNFTYKTDLDKKIQYGLIAEEVEQVKPEFVSYDREGRPETVSYSFLISPLLKAAQEQKAMIQELQRINETQQKAIEALQAEVDRLKYRPGR
jgi:hypothetical protein